MQKVLDTLATLGIAYNPVLGMAVLDLGDDAVDARLDVFAGQWTLRFERKGEPTSSVPAIKALMQAANEDGAKASWPTATLICYTL